MEAILDDTKPKRAERAYAGLSSGKQRGAQRKAFNWQLGTETRYSE
jgi:hypothetical protein